MKEKIANDFCVSASIYKEQQHSSVYISMDFRVESGGRIEEFTKSDYFELTDIPEKLLNIRIRQAFDNILINASRNVREIIWDQSQWEKEND